MCGRYGLYDTDDFSERFETGDSTPPLEPNYNAAPGQYMPVVVGSGGARAVQIMKWGLVPSWAKDENIGYKMINARAETVFEKAVWRGPIKRQRALIPARGFYEWKREENRTPKRPYFIQPEDQDLFAFAGIYETWERPDGQQLSTYSIITTTPSKGMQGIHDRMPVILKPEHEDVWLDPAIEDRDILEELLLPYDGKLELFEVSTDVNNVKNNDERLVQPIDDTSSG